MTCAGLAPCLSYLDIKLEVLRFANLFASSLTAQTLKEVEHEQEHHDLWQPASQNCLCDLLLLTWTLVSGASPN